MRKHSLLTLVLTLLAISATPVYAWYVPQANTTYGSSYGTCLYYNAQGECMIEQYYDPSNVYRDSVRSYPVYNRGYLYRERRNNRRYDYRDYDYYDDDDDWSAIDDDDDYYDDDDHYDDDDDDFDFDRYFDDDDDSFSDDDDDDDDDD